MRLVLYISATLAALTHAAKDPIARLMAEPTPVCNTTNKAYELAREGFSSLRNAQLYMIGAVIQEEPTHSELIEAAKWAVSTVDPAMKEARELNDKDPKKTRKLFLSAKLKYLELQTTTAKKMLAKGIPMKPWLGKAINWVSAVYPKLRDLWRTITKGADAPKEPTGGQPMDINAIVAKIDKKLAELDKQFYDLVNAECKLQ